MATPPTAPVRQVGLLVLEDEASSSIALKQILDSEGWRVRLVPDLSLLHAELKTGEYSLVIANIELVGLDSPTFTCFANWQPCRKKAAHRVLTANGTAN